MKISLFKDFPVKITYGVIVSLLIIIQSCGVIFFDKQGSILVIIILLLSKDGFKYIVKSDLINLGIIYSFLLLSKAVNPAFEYSLLIFQMALVLEAYVFLLSYKRKGLDRLVDDFVGALHFIFLHAFIGFLLYLLVPFLFIKIETGYPYQTLLYIFYVSGEYAGSARNNGLVWEPGLLQLMLNLLLFFSIKRNKSNLLLLAITLTIISTFSTSGYFCLGLNYVFYILTNFKTKKRFVLSLLVISALCSSALLFIWENIADKLGGDNLSGLARYRDLYIGIELIKEKPWIGHGLFDGKYLFTKNYVSRIEVELFGKEILDIIGSISGGFVNGLLDIFAWFGIPAAVILLTLFFKNKYVSGPLYGRIIFFAMMCFTFFAEPITYTSFFLTFPFSFLIKWNNRKNQMNKAGIHPVAIKENQI